MQAVPAQRQGRHFAPVATFLAMPTTPFLWNFRGAVERQLSPSGVSIQRDTVGPMIAVRN
jgi:hypothetical protein